MYDASLLEQHFSGYPAQSLPAFGGRLLPLEHGWAQPKDKGTEHLRPCAVAFLFIPPSGPGAPLRLVLTKRSMLVSSHKGQIAFAGGRKDDRDESPAATAARETEEEIGIDRHALAPVAQLPVHRAVDNSPVTPVIMVSDVSDLNSFRPNPREVDAVLTPDWPVLTDNNCSDFSYPFRGGWRTSYLYEFESHRIWGLTAQMINYAALKARPG